MTDWRMLYTLTVLEADPSRLMVVICEAEDGMEIRLSKLSLDDKERQEIAHATTAPAVLKVELDLWNEDKVV